jgi:hypothetical protein
MTCGLDGSGIESEGLRGAAPDVARKLVEQQDERECGPWRVQPGVTFTASGGFDRCTEAPATLGIDRGRWCEPERDASLGFAGDWAASANQNSRMSSKPSMGASLSSGHQR